jgi:hypothetical protein
VKAWLEHELFAYILEKSSFVVEPPYHSTIQEHGWTLVSAEERAVAFPDTFQIPPQGKRASLSPGDAAKLLFDIETRDAGHIVDRGVDRGVDRMWVIVKARTELGYVGVLDSNPGTAENLKLHEKDLIAFAAEHVAAIGQPPREYILEKYGVSFFEK